MIEEAQRTAMPAADDPREPGAATRTVRDAVFDVMRRFGMTTIFGNPGSTEIPFLTGLPPDIHFVLGLHEGSVVGIATGYAVARREPALVNLHTAAGAGQRDQRDRQRARHAARRWSSWSASRTAASSPMSRSSPAGRWRSWPASTRCGRTSRCAPRTCPAPSRAPTTRRSHPQGPSLVVVPMGDWTEPADEHAAGWPERTAAQRGGDAGRDRRAGRHDQPRRVPGPGGGPAATTASRGRP